MPEPDCLVGFDHARFGVLARSLQVLLAHNAVEHAHMAVRGFAQQAHKRKATRQSLLVDLMPLRYANALEDVGCVTLQAFLAMSNRDIECIPECGEWVISQRDRMRGLLQSGELYEVCGDDEDLYYDFREGDKLPSSLQRFTEGARMSNGMGSISDRRNVSVMDALLVISERKDEACREIDAKLDALTKEIRELKQLKSMLVGKQTKVRALSDTHKVIADLMFKSLRTATSSLKPAEIANLVTSPKQAVTAIIVGKIVKNDKRFVRWSDGRISLA